jgi:hypothetical protein
MPELSNIFADLYLLDIPTLRRAVEEGQRILAERESEADEEANRSNGSSGAPDTAPNGRK